MLKLEKRSYTCRKHVQFLHLAKETHSTTGIPLCSLWFNSHKQDTVTFGLVDSDMCPIPTPGCPPPKKEKEKKKSHKKVTSTREEQKMTKENILEDIHFGSRGQSTDNVPSTDYYQS